MYNVFAIVVSSFCFVIAVIKLEQLARIELVDSFLELVIGVPNFYLMLCIVLAVPLLSLWKELKKLRKSNARVASVYIEIDNKNVYLLLYKINNLSIICIIPFSYYISFTFPDSSVDPRHRKSLIKLWHVMKVKNCCR